MNQTGMRLEGCHCPMGCGETLEALSGTIRCTQASCPRPDAVVALLVGQDGLGTEHEVEIRKTDFTLKHPLRERLEDELFQCPVHDALEALPRPPVDPGRYVVDDGLQHWVKIARS